MPLTLLEIAAGTPLPGVVEPPDVTPAGPPIEALRAIVLSALRRPPCLVSFSGGVDSSAVLAIAVDVARAEGLAPPVPITYRFADAPSAEESGWQERVVAALGAEDWIRVEIGDELDVIGPYALGTARRHGLLWPVNVFFHAPLLERANEGTLLTGIGGDQLIAMWHPRMRALADARARRRRPQPRDVARLVGATRPPAFDAPTPDWLTNDAARAFTQAWRDAEPRSPVRYDDYLRGLVHRRSEAIGRDGLQRLGAVVSPLFEPTFLHALAATAGRDGFGGRNATLRHVLGPLWPPVLDDRRTKATFEDVFWRQPSRRFAETWDGTGVEAALVDPDRLRQAWLDGDLRAPLLLQQLALRAR